MQCNLLLSLWFYARVLGNQISLCGFSIAIHLLKLSFGQYWIDSLQINRLKHLIVRLVVKIFVVTALLNSIWVALEIDLLHLQQAS